MTKLWEKVLSVKQTRLSRLNVTSKYSVLCADLPNEYNSDMGYHKSCYKNFTAIPKLDPIPETTEHTVKKVIRSQVSHHEATSSGVFKSTCIFCGNSRRSGISAFTTNYSARRRWMITHATRSTILGHLFDMAGLRKLEDTTRELEHSRILRDNNDLQKVIDGIVNTLNPFDAAFADENLYCLSTGKSTSPDIKTELLHCVETGEKYCEEFRAQCFKDPTIFEKPIPRRKAKNFSADAVKVKITGKDNKIKELKGTRDLFGRLLHIAASHDLDLEMVFSYPLTPVPLSLAHVDGSINKTDKSKLLHLLEVRVKSEKPESIDACAVDAMFFIRTLINIPETFGLLAKLILTRLFYFAKRVDFVCDSYNTPSIKDIEHDARGSSSVVVVVSTPSRE